jgi:hypothetical protein
MERYMIGDHAHAYIRDFDEGKEVSPGGFILHKPTGGRTLEYKRKESRAYAQRNPNRLRLYSARRKRRRNAKAAKSANGAEVKNEMLLSFRSGKGMVHFIGAVDNQLQVRSELDNANQLT